MFFPLGAKAQDKIPVIIVPGYLASWNWGLFVGHGLENKWEFSLGDDTYDQLIQSFEDEGYVRGQDLFVAFYDWRQSNQDNYQQYLLPVIDQALFNNPDEDWVDIVAHSMGGLFTRGYIQSDDYRDDIRNFIMIATPNYGSVDAYYLWSGGQFPPNMKTGEKSQAAAFLFYRGLTYAGPDLAFSRRKLIQQDIPSTQELLPTNDYLVDFATGLDLPIEGMQARNPLLPTWNDLHSDEGILNVADRVGQLTILAGRGYDTIERIAVDTSTVGSARWQDGRPIDGGVAYSPIGDGSVLGRSVMFPLPRPNFDCFIGPPPVLSWLIPTAHACDLVTFEYGTESIPGWDAVRQEYIYNAGHRSVVTKAIPIVHEVLNQKNIPGSVYEDEDEPEEILAFTIASPIAPEVIAPDGKKISKTTNQIGGQAEYFDDGDPLGPKVIIINNPQAGTYEIKGTGTGEGEFHVGVIKITAESTEPIGSSEELIVPTIAGNTSFGQEHRFVVETIGQGLIVEGEVYGTLPVVGPEADAGVRLRQLIEVTNNLEQADEIKNSTADILRRSFLSRLQQIEKRGGLGEDQSLRRQIMTDNILQQLHSHFSYIEFMTKLRQITPAARDALNERLQQVIETI